jgi:hypothetical protein
MTEQLNTQPDAEQALLAIMKADAKVWHDRHGAFERLVGREEAAGSASSYKLRGSAGPMPAAERKNRAVQRKRTAPAGSKSLGRKPPNPAMTFEGTPCRNCGGTLRYRSQRTCVVCARESTKRSKAKHAA